MKSCCRTMKSSLRSDEIRALPRTNEIKSTHRRSDFIRRRRISYREAVFHPPVRVDFIEKSTCECKCFFLGGPSRARPPAGGAVARESAPPEHFLTRALRALRPAQKKKTPFGVPAAGDITYRLNIRSVTRVYSVSLPALLVYTVSLDLSRSF